MTTTVSKHHLLGAIMLIAGACVGGGMLAIPVETGVAGFVPSVVIMIISWVFMTCTGLLIVEANLWMEEGSHYLTMATRLLGMPGKIVGAILFLFMGYGSLIAYNAAGGDIIEHVLKVATTLDVGRMASCTLYALIFGFALFFSTKVLGKINTILVIAMVFAYIFLVALGVGEAEVALLKFRAWAKTVYALPLLLATFSYQMVVPSLTPYLKRDPAALRKAVIYGTTLPFIVYIVWQFIVLGIVPLVSIEQANELGLAATVPLREFVASKYLSGFATFFGFFALVTSYLAIGLGTVDFMMDTFKIKQKYISAALVVIPCLLFAIAYPGAFLFALNITGGFGDSIMNGLMPVMMVWIGRYRRHIEGPYRLGGEKPVLILLALFALLVFVVQIVELV
ncbi:MAG: Tryptophan-specific transport protein [Chlamydiia bacterium]|nr:Tryptophan-specific transport protein [Chlamydiia bacterium]MCH9615353.1 Tryptophan-specific transport protein [Chlamydiia bacterium]MCH9628325.1 Tryptophan-specific transport protein [Chlamydiia bacterium]